MNVEAKWPYAWGATDDELAREFPCDAELSNGDRALIRAVDVEAPVATVFRWLCQLRVAPYSYDWIDNWGRRSPPELIGGLEKLEIGQSFMSIFELVGLESGRQITLRIVEPRARKLFGDVVCSYVVEPSGDERSRLVCKLVVRYPPGVRGAIARAALPAGDLVMMRKQLLTLKRYAQRDAEGRI